jgi:FixJ family two-component response regulator
MKFMEGPEAAARGSIVLDVQTPGLSGLELQDRLAELGSGLPVVFLTGHGDIPMSVRATKAGAETLCQSKYPG